MGWIDGAITENGKDLTTLNLGIKSEDYCGIKLDSATNMSIKVPNTITSVKSSTESGDDEGNNKTSSSTANVGGIYVIGRTL
jgi:hypothetical protein